MASYKYVNKSYSASIDSLDQVKTSRNYIKRQRIIW